MKTMKKVVLTAFALAMVFALFSCSGNTPISSDRDQKSSAKQLKAVYDSSGENHCTYIPEAAKMDIDKSIDMFFGSDFEEGFIALVTPQCYEYYYKAVLKDEFSGLHYIFSQGDYCFTGWAECVCKIEKLSAKYNASTVKEGEIVRLRQEFELHFPDKSENVSKMLKDVGLLDESTQKAEKVFRITDEYITDDCEIFVSSSIPSIPLSLGKQYYVWVSEKTYVHKTFVFETDDYNNVELSDEFRKIRRACPADGCETVDGVEMKLSGLMVYDGKDIAKQADEFYNFIVSRSDIFN